MNVQQPRVTAAIKARSQRPIPFLLSAFSNPRLRRQTPIRCSVLSKAFVIGAVIALLSETSGFANPLPMSTIQLALGPFSAHVDEAAIRFALPASWIRAVIQVESGGDPRAKSPKGAMGLMQIMPETWVALRFRYGLGADPFDPRDNILAGAAYLRELFDRYGSLGFLAAYNAGPARYETFLGSATPLPEETSAYVALLTRLIDGNAIDPTNLALASVHQWAAAPLFVAPLIRGSIDSRSAANLQVVSKSSDNGPRDLPALEPHSEGLFITAFGRTSSP